MMDYGVDEQRIKVCPTISTTAGLLFIREMGRPQISQMLLTAGPQGYG